VPGTIGSGTAAAPCIVALQRLADDNRLFELLQVEAGIPGGVATILGFDLTRLLQQNLVLGISPYLHICVVRRGSITLAAAHHTEFSNSGPVEHAMPPVATSLRELSEMFAALRVDVSSSAC
jgi:hypothetical protein